MTLETVQQGLPDADELLARADEGLRRARSLGADDAEVYLWYGRTHELRQSHHTRSLEGSDRSGVSVRLLKDGRLTFAKTSGLQEEEIAWAVSQAARSAELVPAQEGFERFVAPEPVERPPTPVHEDLVDLDPDRLRGLADQVQDAAYREASPNHFTERFHTKLGLFAVANTEGVRAWDRHAHESFSVEVRCNVGDRHKAARTLRSARHPIQEGNDLPTAAADAVQRALGATDTAELDGFVDEVILDGFCSLLLLNKILPSLGGRAMHQERSALAGKVGERVVSEQLTLTDKPHGPEGCRHQRVDDEGVPTQETPLIEEGVLRNVVFDWRGAQEIGVAPTGHGFRSITDRYGQQPSARVANAVVEPGDTTLDEMIEAADEAVLIRDAVLGSFTMDKLSGEFSFVAPLAFHVRDGEVRDALVSTSFSGNLFEVLDDIRALGSEPTTFPRGSYVPLHLGEVTCAT